ncbi:hypothetical protein GCM10027452_35090 [Micromonospora halotolerans]
MSYAKVLCVGLVGMAGHVVEVEADLAPGLPGVVISGLPDTALHEARDRVRAAIVNSGQKWPNRRITLNLLPATLPKYGSAFDLAIAVAVLGGSGELPLVPLDATVVLGELGLDGTCADSEIQVTPVALPASAQRGTVVTLRLRVKNISERTCSRDVGADLQELYIKAGAAKVWSSDTCGTGKGSDVQSFTPNFERSYELGWNGRDVSRCANGVAAGPYAPIGTYQLFARVGTKLSEPVKLTITG